IWTVMEDRDGTIWFATYGNGFCKYDPSSKKFTFYSEKDGLSSNNVRSLFRDRKGRMWIATANGLNLWDGKKFTLFNSHTGLAGDRFLRFYEDKQQRLWIGSSGGGLSLLVENDGKISFRNFTSREGLADDAVLCLDEDADGNIWTGNFGGISVVDPSSGKIKKITKKDGLSSNTVYAIAFVDDNYLLVGTNNGIDKLDAAQFRRSGLVHTTHFGKDEGFGGVECNTGSVLKSEDGKIYFGTVKGVFIYDPAQDVQSTIEPLTHVTNVRLFFENFDHSLYTDSAAGAGPLPAHMTFPYNQNHLTFDFAGLSFTVSKKVKYRYMIEGFDQEFTKEGIETFATYSNLPPGNYVFKVIACNSDGKWNTVPASFRFTITPPFWRTWWFYILCSGIFIFGVYSFIRIRTARLERVQEMLREQVQVKTRELREEKSTVEEQKKLIEKKNHDITSSIHYAKRIQDSVLPRKEKLEQLLPSSFILFKPRDIVSGDFYWFTSIGPNENERIVVAAVDCTGHGVPGAFMSLVGNNLLNNIVNVKKISDPQVILEDLHEEVVVSLQKQEQDSGTVDGMDITLCIFDPRTGQLEFSSSGRPLLLVTKNELKKLKIGKHPVGLVTGKPAVFEKASVQLGKGDRFYIYTDGYCDQFGGTEDDKFMENAFEKLLHSLRNTPMKEQVAILEKTISDWKGALPQLDDILVIGVEF
ncbi:MAG TPA: two-component regulator propeller domain-containing protein, partial [Bacteroidia bacterium]